jgi:hypothetical protein
VSVARATLTREDSEWSRKFEEPGQEGWGRFFSKAASKGLPRPFDAAGWRCPNLARNCKPQLLSATPVIDKQRGYCL